MAEQQQADTLSGEQTGQSPSETPAPENTPAEKGGGTPQPPQKDDDSGSVDSQTILKEITKIGGRLTKLEQSRKGKAPIMSKPEKDFSFEYPEEEPQDNNSHQVAQEKELLQFERGVTKLLRNKQFGDLLDKDQTLARVMDNNPMSLIDDPIDAEDAVLKLQEYLEERAEALQPKAEATEEKLTSPQSVPANPSVSKSEAPPQASQGALNQDQMGNKLTDKITGDGRFLNQYR